MKASNFAVLIAALLFAAAQLHGQTVRYTGAINAGSKVKIDGTASISAAAHDWTMESKLVGGFMEIDPAFEADLTKTPKSIKADVIMPVRQFKSGKLEMDNVMYDAMKADTFKNITNRLIELKQVGGKFEALSALSAAGITRTNTVPVTFERVDKNKIKVSASTNLKMTDFGIKPPVLVAIKTGDDVKISFDWIVEKKEAAK